ncbi:MAG: hypothetical protein K1X94_29205 [Sandaracinaceae bacterium]|nr:hypothetical protein [Sandaracinaceae bacterium]
MAKRLETLRLYGLEIDVFRAPARTDHDRVVVHDLGTAVVVALADGAGGLAHARRAAERAAEAAREIALSPSRMLDLDAALLEEGGETTLVALVGVRSPDGLVTVRGASAGDSRAWAILEDGRFVELTEGQSRKRLGSGHARPHPFACSGACRVIVASDGLLDAIGERTLLGAESLAAWCDLVPRDDATGLLVRPAMPPV